MLRTTTRTQTSIAFVALLVINALLFSNSNFGQLSTPAKYQPSLTLTKRFVPLESPICNPGSVPSHARCEHAQQFCPDFISLQSYYCAPEPEKPFIFVGLLVWLIFLFSTLGISASDFFCPNLSSLSVFLGLDHNVAGVTLLAFGNGSPDVFSTFSAMKAGSGSLAIGELIGAATFIVSIVVGSIAIIRPFKVPKISFLRDIGFFTVAVSLLIVIAHDGSIHAWEAALMILLYVIYVFVVVVNSYWERKQERKRTRELIVQQEYTTEEVSRTPYRDEEPAEQTPLLRNLRSSSVSVPDSRTDDTGSHENARAYHSLHEPPQTPLRHLPSFSLIGALEFRQVITSLQRDSAENGLASFEMPVSPFPAGHYHPHLHQRASSQDLALLTSSPSSRSPTRGRYEDGTDPWDATLGVPLSERRGYSPELPNRTSLPLISTIPEIRLETASESYSPTPSEFLGSSRSRSRPATRYQSILNILYHTFHILFPTLHAFLPKTFLGKLVAVFAAPAVLALTITLPVVITSSGGPNPHPGDLGAMNADHPSLIDFEEEGIERTLTAGSAVEEEIHELRFNKWLMTIQCALGPVFCALVLFRGSKHFAVILGLTSAVSVTLAVLVALFANEGNDPAGRLARCFMGFVVAIVWIMAIADEVVTVLQTFGFIFGLSDAIIGLTIFAAGNSLADLIADISIASFAPIMAFSACIGGPMLNILLGIGGSGIYIIRKTGDHFSLHFTSTLMVSSIGLLSLLVATILFVPYNDYWLTKRWGAFLICCYCLIIILNIIVEVKSL